MAITKIFVRLQTQATPGSNSGTTDPLYLGVVTKFGGREFPLRYKKAGLNIGLGQTYEFGVNNSDLPAAKQIYQSANGQPNGIDVYPLSEVERVYLRKEPVQPSTDNDDSIGVEYVAAFITDSGGTVTDWSNRNRPDSSGPSPFWLGNEFGQIAYLKPD
jgi:hypothetical protein